MTTALISLLSREDAQALTDTINVAAESLGELLLSTHDGRAWEAMGYQSWRAYAVAEFRFSQSRAYRLMDHAKVIQTISPLGEKPTERVTRPLVALPAPVQREAWQAAVKASPTGSPTAKQVTAAVEVIAPKKERITYKPANGLQYAAMAISALEKIQPNDIEREEAFDKVSTWVIKRRGANKGRAGHVAAVA